MITYNEEHLPESRFVGFFYSPKTNTSPHDCCCLCGGVHKGVPRTRISCDSRGRFACHIGVCFFFCEMEQEYKSVGEKVSEEKEQTRWNIVPIKNVSSFVAILPMHSSNQVLIGYVAYVRAQAVLRVPTNACICPFPCMCCADCAVTSCTRALREPELLRTVPRP